MPLENGRADERVSRGQASERAVCVREAVSVEKGARRPPLPAAVVCRSRSRSLVHQLPAQDANSRDDGDDESQPGHSEVLE
jgi:hypothetical protein